jgi:valyl-tRNA synthetase
VTSETEGAITEQTPFIVAISESEARTQAQEKYGENITLEQDPDVLDTWFSSGLWPFSTLGWPEETADFNRYYPTSTLVTGFDIIFFWVARMTMMGKHLTGRIPFQDVYIHGLVRDENGKKMSKSLNNGIDPLILIDKYGADALRYTLIREVAGAGQDISLQYNRKTDESESVEASRNFANKLWNAARFVMMNLDQKTPAELGYPAREKLELSDRWILSRLGQAVGQSRAYIENYGLGEAAKGIYEFIWHDFCDWYIELAKPRLYNREEPGSRLLAQQTLAQVLGEILKLLHPFMPHITEEIWQTLTQNQEQVLALQPYPVVDLSLVDSELEASFNLLCETIRTIRNLRATAEIKPGLLAPVILQSENAQERQTLQSGENYLKSLGKIETLTLTPKLEQQPSQAIAGVTGTIQILIPLSGIVDIAALRGKLEKRLLKLDKEIQSLGDRLENPSFINKAPAELIEKVKADLAEAQKQGEILRDRLERLN